MEVDGFCDGEHFVDVGAHRGGFAHALARVVRAPLLRRHRVPAGERASKAGRKGEDETDMPTTRVHRNKLNLENAKELAKRTSPARLPCSRHG